MDNDWDRLLGNKCHENGYSALGSGVSMPSSAGIFSAYPLLLQTSLLQNGEPAMVNRSASRRIHLKVGGWSLLAAD